MGKQHTHRAAPSMTRTTPFFGPVTESRQNTKAHGGVCYVAMCRCGAVRHTNANAGAIERGPWVARA